MSFHDSAAWRFFCRGVGEPDILIILDGLPRSVVAHIGSCICLMSNDETFGQPVSYPPGILNRILGAFLSDSGVRQHCIAGTKKYAPVTFFFSGGTEDPLSGAMSSSARAAASPM